MAKIYLQRKDLIRRDSILLVNKNNNEKYYKLARKLYLKLMEDFYDKYNTDNFFKAIKSVEEVVLEYVIPFSSNTIVYFNDTVLSILKELAEKDGMQVNIDMRDSFLIIKYETKKEKLIRRVKNEYKRYN